MHSVTMHTTYRRIAIACLAGALLLAGCESWEGTVRISSDPVEHHEAIAPDPDKHLAPGPNPPVAPPP